MPTSRNPHTLVLIYTLGGKYLNECTLYVTVEPCVMWRFPLHKMLVKILKTFEIYLHQLTPEALIRVGVLYGSWGAKDWSQMRDVSTIFMSYLNKWRWPRRKSIITILDVTASCLALRRITLCPRFRRSGQVLGWRNDFTWRMTWMRGKMWEVLSNILYDHASTLEAHPSHLEMKFKHAKLLSTPYAPILAQEI